MNWEKRKVSEIENKGVEILGLNAGLLDALKNHGINTIQDLIAVTRDPESKWYGGTPGPEWKSTKINYILMKRKSNLLSISNEKDQKVEVLALGSDDDNDEHFGEETIIRNKIKADASEDTLLVKREETASAPAFENLITRVEPEPEQEQIIDKAPVELIRPETSVAGKSELEENVVEPSEETIEKDEIVRDYYVRRGRSISDTKLSNRAKNSLIRAGYETDDQLLLLDEKTLLSIRNIGRQAVAEILAYKERMISEAKAKLANDAEKCENLKRETVVVGLINNPEENAGGNPQKGSPRKRDQVEEPADHFDNKNNLGVTRLSERVIYRLQREGVCTVDQLMELDDETIESWKWFGLAIRKKIICERDRLRNLGPDNNSGTKKGNVAKKHKNSNSLECGSVSEKENAVVKETVDCDDLKAVQDYYVKFDKEILGSRLSNRAKNGLMRNGIKRFSQLLECDEELLFSIRNFGTQSVDEIIEFKRELISVAASRIKDGGMDAVCVPQKETLESEDIQRILEEYFLSNDFEINVFELSVRSRHALEKYGISRMSQLVKLSNQDISVLQNIGKLSSLEIINEREKYAAPIRKKIISGEIDESNVHELSQEKILGILSNALVNNDEGDGLSEEDVSQMFGNDRKAADRAIQIFREKVINGELIINRVGKYELKKPSVFEVVEALDNEKYKDILKKRLSGLTLEEVGADYAVTRERIRQLQKKAIESLKYALFEKFSTTQFKEDTYKRIYTKYYFTKELWENCFHDLKTYYVLQLLYDKGTLPLEDSVSDPGIENSIQKSIQQYLDNDVFEIDGVRLPYRRYAIQDYLISTYCLNDTKFEDFLKLYNEFLEKYIPEERRNRLAIDSDGTAYNHLAEEKSVLWKPGRTFRYYDTRTKDFSELLEGLDLGSFHDTYITANKLFEENLSLMQDYDIHDGYELHNLLKKIGVDEIYPELKFGRNPTLSFGVFDRDQAVFQIMTELAPVSIDELAQAISDRFGYDINTIKANWLVGLEPYYHMGFYSIEQKPMSDNEISVLNDTLKEDFYRISQITEIYQKLFPGEDNSKVSPYNLKRLGFKVYTDYCVQNYENSQEYFRTLLQKDDIFDIRQYNKKFSGITEYTSALCSIRDDHEIIEFEENTYINIRKLQKAGVTKTDLQAFCDDVYDFVTKEFPHRYFTLKYLVENGFENRLDILGFGPVFSSSVLKADYRFAHDQRKESTLFRLGGSDRITGVRELLKHLMSEVPKITVDDCLDLLQNHFGMTVDKWDLMGAASKLGFYYDSVMETVYSDYETYLSEIGEED